MTTTAATISPWPLVRQGDRQHPVKTLQYLLRARGRHLTVDGIFGPETDAAVRAFQQQNGLAVNGIVGPQHLVRAGHHGQAGQRGRCRPRGPGGVPVPQLVRRPGQGPAGQRDLRRRTDAAVRGFQKALHRDIPSVTVDGIVGPVTWRALVSGMLSSDRRACPVGWRNARSQPSGAASSGAVRGTETVRHGHRDHRRLDQLPRLRHRARRRGSEARRATRVRRLLAGWLTRRSRRPTDPRGDLDARRRHRHPQRLEPTNPARRPPPMLRCGRTSRDASCSASASATRRRRATTAGR